MFSNISNEIKGAADAAWQLAMAKRNPVEAAEFLNNVTNYYRNLNYSSEEIEFLQFYFNMKMENNTHE